MTVYQHVLCCIVILVLCNLQGGAEAKRRRIGSDILMAAMQDSISLLTELTTDQADKIASLTEDQADKIASLTKDQADNIASLTAMMTTKLDEAKEEIGQLKRDLSSSQSKIVEAKEEIEQLKRDRSTSQSKIAQLENGTALFHNKTKIGIEELKNNLSSSQSKMAQFKNNTMITMDELKSELAENLEEKRAELVNATSSMKNESEAGMEELKSELSNDIEDLAAKLEDIDIGWPEGSYCILGSGGSCPAGFTRIEGYINAIYTFSSASYMRAATFGDSSIVCRHGCSYSSTNHNANLRIVSCCK